MLVGAVFARSAEVRAPTVITESNTKAETGVGADQGGIPDSALPAEVVRETEGPGSGMPDRGAGLRIRWTSGHVSRLSSQLLRSSCPCARCEELRGGGSHDAPLSPAKGRKSLTVLAAGADEQLNLRSVSAVGNYALSLLWGDGHDTGIYSFVLLRSLHSSAERSSRGGDPHPAAET